MADDDKKVDEHKDKATAKPAEDLTPTPTQAEIDKIMSGLSDEDLAKAKKPEAKAGAEPQSTPTSTPPHMTQEENDMAMRKAASGAFPPEGSTDPQKKKDEEEKRKKDMEAEQPAAGYQTRAAKPTK